MTQQQEDQPLPIEPGHVMSWEQYRKLLEQQK
jgi:hypothetical protein